MTYALRDHGTDVRIVAARVRSGAEQTELPAPAIDLGAQRSGRLARQMLFENARTPAQKASATEAFGILLNQSLTKSLERLDRDWGIDAVYERYSLWSYAAASFARAAKIPYVVEVNAPLVEEQIRFRRLENRAAAESFREYVFRSADRIFVPASALTDHVAACGARRSSVHVVPNAADPHRFTPVAPSIRRRDKNDRDFVIGFLGTIKPWHGVDNLARAYLHLRRRSDAYRLLIVGEGPLRSELKRTFQQAGCGDSVTFTGAADRDGVTAYLSQMDVAVAPYSREKNFYFSPLKIYEYMAAGVPIVASDIGQIGEVLRHRKSALLHRPGAIREMVQCIEELRKKPKLADRIAREARSLSCRRFTWSRNAKRVLSMVETVRRQRSRS
jgi:glycosyltransferase involved in cell wall biosynthesis